MPKERSVNPATAQLKADKARALKKSKAAVTAQRTERLAGRNPESLQRRIDEIKGLESSSAISAREKQELEKLERDVASIRKARAAQGGRGGTGAAAGRGGRAEGGMGREGRRWEGSERKGGGNANDVVLGKRRRWTQDEQRENGGDESEQTDEDVRAIPMPRDTPPPIPPKWIREGRSRPGRQEDAGADLDMAGREEKTAVPARPAQTVYSSAPQIRDLRKEATSAFVPAAVAARLKQKRQLDGEGEGRLLQPEEVDALERDGYLGGSKENVLGTGDGEAKVEKDVAEVEEEEEEEDPEIARELRELQALDDAAAVADEAEKEAQFAMMADENAAGMDEESLAEKNLRRVEMEEVEDEDI